MMKSSSVRSAMAFILPLVLPTLLLLFWAGMARRINAPIILPMPETVFGNLASPMDDIISMGSLIRNISFSMARVMIGFALAAMTAIPLGILISRRRLAEKLLSGSIAFLRAIPPLAWVPIVLAWCGMANLAALLGIADGPMYAFLHNIKLSIILIIFIGGFYPILTSAIHGVSQVPATLIESAAMLGATEKDIFLKVLLPASVPSIVSGMRISLGMSWMCVVASEMMPGSPIGLGFMIMHAFTIGRIDVVITGMICIGMVSSLLDWLFRRCEKRFLLWKK